MELIPGCLSNLLFSGGHVVDDSNITLLLFVLDLVLFVSFFS